MSTPDAASQITEVLMPLMGEGINEATLVKWLKKPGERVAKSEPLLEVSTDKVDTEIPAPAEGWLTGVFAEEGATVAINAVIAHIGSSPDARPAGATAARPASAATTAPAPATNKASNAAPSRDAGASQPPATRASSPAALPLPSPGTHAGATLASFDDVRSSPLVRKMAKDYQIDLRLVRGSGLHGRVTRDDIARYLTAPPPAVSAGPQAAGSTVPPLHRLETKRDANNVETLDGVPVRREKMTRMRRLIAEHMLETARVAPHVTTVFEIDLDRVVAQREKEKAAFATREGFGLTYTPYFIHAAVQAIKAHPIVNCSVDGDEILHKDQINIGCAVALGTGLIVPVIREANDLSFVAIARRLNDIVSRARTKKLLPEDVQGGTFSITNPGGMGSLTSNPLINQPQVAIMGIGAIVKRPVVVKDAIVIRPMILISLTFDHRVVDGEGGAAWLATLKSKLESWNEPVTDPS